MRAVTVALITTAVLALATGPAAAATPPPPGANLPCTPTAAHPYPVVLVHGTAESMFDNWQAMSPALKAAGYCVYAFNYGSYNGSGAVGVYGLGDIAQSAQELKTYVDSVLARTGAAKVDLVGHSQGGMMPRYYMKNLGGGDRVDDLVGPLAVQPRHDQPARPAARRDLPGVRPAGGGLVVHHRGSTAATRRPAARTSPTSRRATTRSSRPTPRPSWPPTATRSRTSRCRTSARTTPPSTCARPTTRP